MSEIACRYAVHYKGKRPPKCGCLTCRVVWQQAVIDKLLLQVEQLQREVQRHEQQLATLYVF